MTYEKLIERLRHDRYDWMRSQAADRIEELEKTVEFQKAAWAAEHQELNALLADNERLRDMTERNTNGWYGLSPTWVSANPELAENQFIANAQANQEVLAATLAQSLARIRNQVREECAVVLEFNGWLLQAAEVIRAMKEPE